MKKLKLLIATTNIGKFKEIKHILDDLNFEIVSLNDLDEKFPEPEETEPTIEGNALLKAKYYGEKTGLLSLADDTGLFVGELGGWPGVKAARVSDHDDGRRETLLEKMKDIPKGKRGAEFRSVCAFYNPNDKTTFIAFGKVEGEILQEASDTRDIGFGYNPVFYVTEVGKVFSEMTIQEKNACSQRGRAVVKIKYFLENQFSPKHIVVPFALIVKNGKVFMGKRNDPHRLDYHDKWEFPGGSVEFGEQMVENLKREIIEEAGYEIEVVKMLQHIAVESQEFPTLKYQVFLVPYVCKITGGDGNYSDSEILAIDWFDPDDILNHEMIGENMRMYKVLLSEFKQVIKEYKL